MISNLIFDLGRVLLTFEPRAYLEKLCGDCTKTELLLKAVFGSPSWLDLDRGVIDEEQAFEKMAASVSYREEIRYLLYHWDEILVPIKPSVQILDKLKSKNYSVYLLSNFHRRAYERVFQKYPFFRLFNGILISSDTGLIKPDPAIYKMLVDNYSIAPQKSVFIDDTAENVSAAEKLGMKGLIFHDAAQLEQDLIRLGVLDKQG